MTDHYLGGNRVLRYSCVPASRVPLRRAGAFSGSLRRRAPHRLAGTQAATSPAAASCTHGNYLQIRCALLRFKYVFFDSFAPESFTLFNYFIRSKPKTFKAK